MRVQPILLLALLILLRPDARYALAPGSRKVAQILPSAFKNKKLCHLPAAFKSKLLGRLASRIKTP